MFNFGCADAECEGPECTMGLRRDSMNCEIRKGLLLTRGMRITANTGDTRKGETLLWTYDMYDTYETLSG